MPRLRPSHRPHRARRTGGRRLHAGGTRRREILAAIEKLIGQSVEWEGPTLCRTSASSSSSPDRSSKRRVRTGGPATARGDARQQPRAGERPPESSSSPSRSRNRPRSAGACRAPTEHGERQRPSTDRASRSARRRGGRSRSALQRLSSVRELRGRRVASAPIPTGSPAPGAIGTRDVRTIVPGVTSRTMTRRFLDWASTCQPS